MVMLNVQNGVEYKNILKRKYNMHVEQVNMGILFSYTGRLKIDTNM